MKKRAISLVGVFIAVSVMLICAFVFSSAAVFLGDVDGNGAVNSSDARFVLRFSARLEAPNEFQARISDVNTDSKINSSDARIILRMAAKLESTVVFEETTEEPVSPSDPTSGLTPPPEETSSEISVPTSVPVSESDVPSPPSTSVPVSESDAPSSPPTSVPVSESEDTKIESMTYDNYYMSISERTYSNGGGFTEKTYAVAVRTNNTSVDGKNIVSHDCFMRSSEMINGKKVGFMFRENVDGFGRIRQDQYILNYDTNEYLCMDSSFIKKYPDKFTYAAVPDDYVTAATVYPSIDALDTVAVKAGDVVYQRYRSKAANGCRVDFFLMKCDDGWRPAIIRKYDSSNKVISDTIVNYLTKDPSQYFSVSGMKGLTVTAQTFPENAVRFKEFMTKLGY